MTKPKPANTEDISVLLTFPDSGTGETVIAELTQRLRDSESALAAHKERHDDAALKSDDALAKHHEETAAFERASARLSVAIEHARKRLAEVQQAERQQAGATARAKALEIDQECSSLLRELLNLTKAIAFKVAHWNAQREEMDRLNSIANAGGADAVPMPGILDSEEAEADASAQTAHDFGNFLSSLSQEAFARKHRAWRKAEAEKKERAEAPTDDEVAKLRAKGFDPEILSREPRNADEGYGRTLVRQELRGMRGQGVHALGLTNRF